MQIVSEIYSHDRKRRVQIIQRCDNLFSFNEEYYSDDPLELNWCETGRATISLYDSTELAEQEARRRLDWLAEIPHV